MIHAINKHGMKGDFTETAWELLKGDRAGWQEVGMINMKQLIPDKIKEFQAAKKEVPQVEVIESSTDSAATMDIMREALEAKGVAVHHKLGYDKLKQLYDEHNK